MQKKLTDDKNCNYVILVYVYMRLVKRNYFILQTLFVYRYFIKQWAVFNKIFFQHSSEHISRLDRRYPKPSQNIGLKDFFRSFSLIE